MINKKQFINCIIRPTLSSIDMLSSSSEVLLLGTALVESNLSALKQYNNGPALGLYQMEPNTHEDIWDNYLQYRSNLASKIMNFMLPGLAGVEQLQGNLYYATAMARIHYRRIKQSLPLASDPEGLAKYHKDHYNTSEGKANIENNIPLFRLAYETSLE